MLKRTLLSIAVLATLPAYAMAASAIRIDANSSLGDYNPTETAYEATGSGTGVYFEGQTWAMTPDTLSVKSESRGFGIYSDSQQPTSLTVGNDNSTINVEVNAKTGIGILVLRDPRGSV